MAFVYHRTVYFRDTDGAGVVYFAQVLAFCHEAYESSLAAVGIELPHFFRAQTLAVPITHADVDFFAPLTCGQALGIVLTPQRGDRSSEFAITYQVHLLPAPQAPPNPSDRPAAIAHTRHVCIHPTLRHRCDRPPFLENWLDTWG